MKIKNKNKFVKGNINTHSVGNYIIGRFMGEKGFPEQETEEVEVAWKKLNSSDGYIEEHFHKKGVEINIVIAGGCNMNVNGEKVSLQKEDFLIVYPESKLGNFEVEDGTEMIIVKAPSIAGDKFEV